eukprot:2802435-Heterocapsa_arctica.AAC.1
MDCRKPPLVWEGDFVTSFVPDPDGHASYGRVNWHGTRGVVPVSISKSSATRIHTYTESSSENIGHYSDGRALKLYKSLTGPGCYYPHCTHNLDAVAASAEVRNKWVDLWLVDTGCAHDLVNKSDALRCCKKLQALANNMPFQTANGCT